jgi:hypothetical protein
LACSGVVFFIGPSGFCRGFRGTRLTPSAPAAYLATPEEGPEGKSWRGSPVKGVKRGRSVASIVPKTTLTKVRKTSLLARRPDAPDARPELRVVCAKPVLGAAPWSRVLFPDRSPFRGACEICAAKSKKAVLAYPAVIGINSPFRLLFLNHASKLVYLLRGLQLGGFLVYRFSPGLPPRRSPSTPC